MAEWKKTSCVLCGLSCGLEVMTERNRITKVRGDRNAPITRILCRKGANVAYFQNNPERLKYPLNGSGITSTHLLGYGPGRNSNQDKSNCPDPRPRSIAFMGGIGQGCRFQAFFAYPFLEGLGSKNRYSPLARSSPAFWVEGKAYGRQYIHTTPNIDGSDFVVFWGTNPIVSIDLPGPLWRSGTRKKKPVRSSPW